LQQGANTLLQRELAGDRNTGSYNGRWLLVAANPRIVARANATPHEFTRLAIGTTRFAGNATNCEGSRCTIVPSSSCTVMITCLLGLGSWKKDVFDGSIGYGAFLSGDSIEDAIAGHVRDALQLLRGDGRLDGRRVSGRRGGDRVAVILERVCVGDHRFTL
jgi:hypothetical protein